MRTLRVDAPAELSETREIYDFGGFAQGTVLLDRHNGRWLLYYRTTDPLRYRIKVAPVRYR